MGSRPGDATWGLPTLRGAPWLPLEEWQPRFLGYPRNAVGPNSPCLPHDSPSPQLRPGNPQMPRALYPPVQGGGRELSTVEVAPDGFQLSPGLQTWSIETRNPTAMGVGRVEKAVLQGAFLKSWL